MKLNQTTNNNIVSNDSDLINKMNNYYNNVIKIINNKNCYLTFYSKLFKSEYNNQNFLNYLMKNIDYAISISSDNRFTLIIDLYLFDRKNVKISTLTNIAKLFRINNLKYKDKMKKIIIINYTKKTKFLFNVIKMFIKKEDKKKIEFRNSENVIEDIDNILD